MGGPIGMAKGAKLDVKATGRKDKISGFDVEEYTVVLGSTIYHSWVTKDYPNYKALLDAMNVEPLNGGIDLSAFPGMSIKTLVESKNLPATTIYLESAKEGTIDPAEFRAPAEYRWMEIPAKRGQ